MKIKNIIILGGIVFAIYYLSKKKGKRFAQLKNEGAGGVLKDPDYVEGDKPMPDDGDKDLIDVSNGEEPQTLSADEKLKLFNEANLSYRGGARPSERLLADISRRNLSAISRLKELGLLEEFKKWKLEQDLKRKFEEGYPKSLPIKGNPFKPIKIGRPDYERHIQLIRKQMPLPRNRTYGVNTLGLANEPRMAV